MADPRVWTILAYLFSPGDFVDPSDVEDELNDPDAALNNINEEIMYDGLGIGNF